MPGKTFRIAVLCAFFALLALAPQVAFGAGSPDMTIAKIDPSDVRCGGSCGGDVLVEVANKGRELNGGYNVFIELKVYERGQASRAKTYKEKLFNFPGETSKTVTFRDVRVQRCSRPYVFEAKVYVVGGNFREGNTRNNDLKYQTYIRNQCKSNGPTGNTGGGSATNTGGSGGSGGGSGNTGGSGGNTGGNTGSSSGGGTSASPDMTIAKIDASGVRCGGSCGGDVLVEVANKGRELKGGYNVFIELKVYEENRQAQAKTYKEKLFNFPGETSQTVTFRDIRVQSCGRQYVFEAKVYVVGGNFREGNTRNNDLKYRTYIRNECKPTTPSGGGSTGGGTSGGSGGGGTGGGTGGSNTNANRGSGGNSSGSGGTSASPDLTIRQIDIAEVRAGKCNSTVEVEVYNEGRALNGGYNVFVELKVYEQNRQAQAKTYKEKLFNFPGTSGKTVRFDKVRVLDDDEYVFEAKVYVVGGNFREGNTRNNDRRVSERIRQTCR